MPLEIITKEEIGKDFNKYQIEGFEREVNDIIKRFKDCGLMAPDICYIAHGILEKLSDKAKEQIKMFGKCGKLDQTLAKAEAMLRQLEDK